MNRIAYLQAQDDSDSKAKEETGDVLRCECYIHAALPRHGTVVRPSCGTWQESLLAILTDLESVTYLTKDLIRAGHLMVELPARALGLLVLYRYLDVVTYLEVDLAAIPVYVTSGLFLGPLYSYTSRFLGLVYTFYYSLGFLSV